MSERRSSMTDDRLEHLLRSVAAEVDYPVTPALAPGVRRRLEEMPKPGRMRSPAGFRRWQPAFVAVGVLVIALVGTLTFSPRAREAVADLIGVGGVQIGFDDAPTASPNDEVDLGPEVTQAEATDEVGFEVKAPQLPELGTPQIHLTRPPEAGMVSLYYPDAYDEGGLLVTQFRADIDEVFFKKLTMGDATVEYLSVRGVPAYWVEGSHFFAYVGPDGEIHEESLRIAENVLLWEEDGITYRVEGGFGKAEALRIADSLPE